MEQILSNGALMMPDHYRSASEPCPERTSQPYIVVPPTKLYAKSAAVQSDHGILVFRLWQDDRMPSFPRPALAPQGRRAAQGAAITVPAGTARSVGDGASRKAAKKRFKLCIDRSPVPGRTDATAPQSAQRMVRIRTGGRHNG